MHFPTLFSFLTVAIIAFIVGLCTAEVAEVEIQHHKPEFDQTAYFEDAISETTVRTGQIDVTINVKHINQDSIEALLKLRKRDYELLLFDAEGNHIDAVLNSHPNTRTCDPNIGVEQCDHKHFHDKAKKKWKKNKSDDRYLLIRIKKV